MTMRRSQDRPFGFKWFVPELLRHKAIWRDVLLASLAIQLMALATPVFTQVVIDKVIVHHTMNTLVVIGIALFVFMVFTAGMSWVRQYLVLHTGNRIDAVLGAQVFGHLFKLPPRYFEHRPTGTLVARVHGVETIREFLSGAAVTLILDVPFLLIFLAIMFYYSWLLTLITLAILGLIVVLSLTVTPLLRARINQQFLLGARNQAFLTEYVSGMETVKSLQMEPQLTSRFGDYLASYLAASFSTRQLANTYNVAANTLEQLLTLGILCVGAWMVMNNVGMTIGMLVAFQMFASRLSGPLLRMVGLWQEFQQADIAVKRLGDVMNAPTEPYSLTPSRETAARGRIEVRNLSFRYGDNLPYLYRDLNLTHSAGAVRRPDGPLGLGQEHARQTAAGVLSAERRQPADRRPRYPPSVGQRTAAAFRRGAAGDHPLQRHDLRQPDPRQPARGFSRRDPGLQARRDPRHHRATARRLSDQNRRAWSRALGRTETASRHCPGAAQASEDPGIRRSDEQPRQPDGGKLCEDGQSAERQSHHAVHHPPVAEGAAGR